MAGKTVRNGGRDGGGDRELGLLVSKPGDKATGELWIGPEAERGRVSWERTGEFRRLGGIGPLADDARNVAIFWLREALRRDPGRSGLLSLLMPMPLRGEKDGRDRVGDQAVDAEDAVGGRLVDSRAHERQGEGSVSGDGERSHASVEGRMRGAFGVVGQGAVAGRRGRSTLMSESAWLANGAVWRRLTGVSGDESRSTTESPVALSCACTRMPDTTERSSGGGLRERSSEGFDTNRASSISSSFSTSMVWGAPRLGEPFPGCPSALVSANVGPASPQVLPSAILAQTEEEDAEDTSAPLSCLPTSEGSSNSRKSVEKPDATSASPA